MECILTPVRDRFTAPERSYPMAKSDDPRRVAEVRHSPPLPAPRDPEIAVREEYELALARRSAEALELFIQRHADHSLAAKARSELQRMQRKDPR